LGIEGSGRARSLASFELKDLAGAMGTVSLPPNEKRVAEDRRDCYWLYVVTDCSVGQASSLSFEAPEIKERIGQCLLGPEIMRCDQAREIRPSMPGDECRPQKGAIR